MPRSSIVPSDGAKAIRNGERQSLALNLDKTEVRHHFRISMAVVARPSPQSGVTRIMPTASVNRVNISMTPTTQRATSKTASFF
jgi:hypothetical protein